VRFTYTTPVLITKLRMETARQVQRMTLSEQLNQLLTEAPAIPRLGLGRYQYWGEALHGTIGPGTTVFPQVRRIMMRRCMMRCSAALCRRAAARYICRPACLRPAIPHR
jgi:hypothetical protein